MRLCTDPESELYDTPACRTFRGEGVEGHVLDRFAAQIGALVDGTVVSERGDATRGATVCGEGYGRCIDTMRTVWEEQQAAAERHYDRSAKCGFTTFHGYEYTATPAGAKVHHNVIFRNANVIENPIAYADTPDVYDLWAELDRQCLSAGIGCDVITLPHNSNLSNGRMFEVMDADRPLAEQQTRARLRRDIERLAEISQIKGDSECRNGMYQVVGANDEYCDFEEWRPAATEDCEEGTSAGGITGQGCVNRTDYIRYALIDGLRQKERIGINPYKLGILAATDAHNGNPGDTNEASFAGWQGSDDDTAAERLSYHPKAPPLVNGIEANPGGLAGVWAEENSRDALFDGMKRRETFGTSGTRLTARFFGGFGLDPALCDAPDLIARGYAEGVPMGGDLPAASGAAAPTFVVSAMRDPGTGPGQGGLLQRAQIIKGWVDDDGHFHSQVIDVAGGRNEASVDVNSCTPEGPGHDTLCGVWQDPDFDPERDAVYYVRVLENPSCRWHQWECIGLEGDARPESCDSDIVPRTVQERLWTSPIWYDAAAARES